jgi:hypothetical protein
MENYFTYLQIVTDTTTTLEKKKRLYLVLHERYFLRGDYVAQSRLQPQILKLLQESGIRRMVMRKGLIEAFISLLSTSPSYDEAGQRSDIIALFGADLTKDQLNRVAECIVTNDQVHPSWKAQRGLKQVLNARVGELNPIILDKLKQVKWIT